MKKTSGILIILFLLATFACNKYEYGPNVSLRTKKGRLTNEWELKQIVLNRTDTVALFNPTEIIFDKDDNVRLETTFTNTSIGDSTVVQEGKWTFDNEGLSIVVIYTDSLGQKDAELYDIVKLTNDELWLSQMHLTDEYLYYFEEKL